MRFVPTQSGCAGGGALLLLPSFRPSAATVEAGGGALLLLLPSFCPSAATVEAAWAHHSGIGCWRLSAIWRTNASPLASTRSPDRAEWTPMSRIDAPHKLSALPEAQCHHSVRIGACRGPRHGHHRCRIPNPVPRCRHPSDPQDLSYKARIT